MSRSTRLGHRDRFGKILQSRSPIKRTSQPRAAHADKRETRFCVSATIKSKFRISLNSVSFQQPAPIRRTCCGRRPIRLLMEMSARRRLFRSAFNTGRNFYRHSHGNLQRESFPGRSTDHPWYRKSSPKHVCAPRAQFSQNCQARRSVPFPCPTLIYLTKKKKISTFMLFILVKQAWRITRLSLSFSVVALQPTRHIERIYFVCRYWR